MRRWGWKIALLLLAAAVLFLWLIKTPLIATYLTHRMGVPVSIEWISIAPSKTKIDQFQINNPLGYRSTAAFKAKGIEVDYKWRNLFQNPVEIDQIAADQILLDIELSPQRRGAPNNWAAIGAKMPKEKDRSRELKIHKLILTNITVSIRGLGPVPQTKKIDRLEFDEIDSTKGFPTRKLIQAIFQGAGVQDYIKDIFEVKPIDLLQKLFSASSTD